MRAAQGYAFEGSASTVLKKGGKFMLRALEKGVGRKRVKINESASVSTAPDPEKDEPELRSITLEPTGDCPISGTSFRNIDELSKILRLAPNSQNLDKSILSRYKEPRTRNPGAADGLSVVHLPGAEKDQYQLILFQYTISAKHGIPASALNCVWDAYPGDLKKSCKTEVCSVCVISTDLGDEFSPQVVIAATNENQQKDKYPNWQEVIKQKVLKMTDLILWG